MGSIRSVRPLPLGKRLIGCSSEGRYVLLRWVLARCRINIAGQPLWRPLLEVLSWVWDELELVPSLVGMGPTTPSTAGRGTRAPMGTPSTARQGDPARQGLQTGQLTLLGLTATADQPLSRRKGPHGSDGSHGVAEEVAAVPRSELVEPCGTPAEVVQHHRVLYEGWRPGSLLEEAPTRGPLSCERLVRCRFTWFVGRRWSLLTLFFPSWGGGRGGGILALGAVLGGRLSGFLGQKLQSDFN